MSNIFRELSNTMSEFGYLDFIFLGIIILTTITGFLKGFAKELCGFLGIVSGVFFASRFAHSSGQWFSTNVANFGSDSAHTLVGFIIIFSTISIFFYISGKILGRIINAIFPTYLNKLLGALFGALKSFLALSLIFHLAFRLDFLQSLQTYWASNSKLYSTMESISSAIISSNLISNAPKDSQEVKQELNDLKDKTIQGVQELKEKALDKSKEIVEQIQQPTQTPSTPQPTPQEGQ